MFRIADTLAEMLKAAAISIPVRMVCFPLFSIRAQYSLGRSRVVRERELSVMTHTTSFAPVR